MMSNEKTLELDTESEIYIVMLLDSDIALRRA